MSHHPRHDNSDGLSSVEGLGGFYQADGICFRYPSDWAISRDDRGNEISISVTSSNAAFWSIYAFRDHPSLEEVLDTALDILRSEYDDLDVYPSSAQLSNQETLAVDVDFSCWELINSAFLRACRFDSLTVLVMYQANDAELEVVGNVFQSMCDSLVIE